VTDGGDGSQRAYPFQELQAETQSFKETRRVRRVLLRQPAARLMVIRIAS
jgi:hypothetical protein